MGEGQVLKSAECSARPCVPATIWGAGSEQRESWSSALGLLAQLSSTLPWLLLQEKKGVKTLLQSFCITCFLHASKKQTHGSLLCASGNLPGQLLAKECGGCKASAGIPGESGQIFGGELRGWEGKGGLLIRQTTSSSGNPPSWKGLKAVWKLGRKYFISLPFSYFTLDIHLWPFLEKRFWTLIWPSAGSLASLGRIFLTAVQTS